MIQKIEKYIENLEGAINKLLFAIDDMPPKLQDSTRRHLKELELELDRTKEFYQRGRKLI